MVVRTLSVYGARILIGSVDLDLAALYSPPAALFTLDLPPKRCSSTPQFVQAQTELVQYEPRHCRTFPIHFYYKVHFPGGADAATLRMSEWT